MTPEDLAARHPSLFHLTCLSAVPSILKHGLLPTTELLTLFDASAAQRMEIEGQPRPTRVELRHPVHGRALITDNSPLRMAALAACLDDGLSPLEWLHMLNRRVFFWVAASGLQSLAGARLNRDVDMAILVLDTLSAARAHYSNMELCPINSGATIRRPARRGLATYAPLARYDYATWRGLRGGRDSVKEVTVVGGLTDLAVHITEIREIRRS
jgi:hypothetical protein